MVCDGQYQDNIGFRSSEPVEPRILYRADINCELLLNSFPYIDHSTKVRIAINTGHKVRFAYESEGYEIDDSTLSFFPVLLPVDGSYVYFINSQSDENGCTSNAVINSGLGIELLSISYESQMRSAGWVFQSKVTRDSACILTWLKEDLECRWVGVLTFTRNERNHSQFFADLRVLKA